MPRRRNHILTPDDRAWCGHHLYAGQGRPARATVEFQCADATILMPAAASRGVIRRALRAALSGLRGYARAQAELPLTRLRRRDEPTLSNGRPVLHTHCRSERCCASGHGGEPITLPVLFHAIMPTVPARGRLGMRRSRDTTMRANAWRPSIHRDRRPLRFRRSAGLYPAARALSSAFPEPANGATTQFYCPGERKRERWNFDPAY